MGPPPATLQNNVTRMRQVDTYFLYRMSFQSRPGSLEIRSIPAEQYSWNMHVRPPEARDQTLPEDVTELIPPFGMDLVSLVTR